MEIDPSPLFALSLIPYLIFLYFIDRSEAIPKMAIMGFRLTLLFVIITIAAAVIAERYYSKELTDVDFLHGGAESFLTIANCVLLIGLKSRNTSKSKQPLREASIKGKSSDDNQVASS